MHAGKCRKFVVGTYISVLSDSRVEMKEKEQSIHLQKESEKKRRVPKAK